MEKFERLFSIRKTYFLQVKRLILVGTLEKCALILKSSSIVGLVMGAASFQTKRLVSFRKILKISVLEMMLELKRFNSNSKFFSYVHL
ncbi:hypothetical protein LEP1GSC021_1326 [Leptospira noguchii str. 1993005606]|nr:hypothetical protein LEP1GSC021_1326 [Leptospira noguchii str. 1993005606]